MGSRPKLNFKGEISETLLVLWYFDLEKQPGSESYKHSPLSKPSWFIGLSPSFQWRGPTQKEQDFSPSRRKHLLSPLSTGWGILNGHHSCVWRMTLPLFLSWAWQVQDAMLSAQKHGWGAAAFAAQVVDAVMDWASYTGTLALVDTCGFDNHHWFSRRFIFSPIHRGGISNKLWHQLCHT